MNAPSRRLRARARAALACSTLVAFLAAVPLLLLATRAVVPAGLRPGLDAAGPRPAGAPATAEAAKRAHMWWAYPEADPDRGLPLALLDEGAALARLFPGYRDALRRDADLWRRYFSRTFDVATTWPAGDPGREWLVSLSWTGCLDVFERHGADVVVLGSSETARAVPAERLADALPGSPRVLLCARGGMLPESVVATAGYIRRVIEAGGQRRPSKVVLGYPLWWAYPASPWRERGANARRDQERTFEAFLRTPGKEPAARPALRKVLALKGPDLVGTPSWGAIEPLRLDDRWRREEERGVGPGRLATSVARGRIRQGQDQEGFYFHATDAARVADLARAARPYFAILDGQRARGCADVREAARELEAVVAALRSVADTVYVYLSPVTPLQTAYAHPCLRESAEALLAAAAGPGVRVRTDAWEAYGLTWLDFAMPTDDPETRRLDVNHTNAAGARKVTAALAAWAAEP